MNFIYVMRIYVDVDYVLSTKNTEDKVVPRLRTKVFEYNVFVFKYNVNHHLRRISILLPPHRTQLSLGDAIIVPTFSVHDQELWCTGRRGRRGRFVFFLIEGQMMICETLYL